MDVHLRHLRWFIILAEELHFGRAAQRLHVTQSALSKAIRRLESDLDVPLLLRTSRSVELTPAGCIFRDAAIRVLDEASNAAAAARRSSVLGSPRLRVGYCIPIADVLTGLVENLEAQVPKIRVELCNFLYTDISAGLRDHTTDAAFTVPDLDIEDLGYLPLFRDPRVALLPSTHPLARRRHLDLHDLRKLDETDTWLLPPGQPSGSESFRRFWCAADALDDRFPPRTRTFTSNEAMAQLIATGRGVGLGFRCLVSRYTLPGITALPVTGLPPASIGFAWRRTHVHPALPQAITAAEQLRGNGSVDTGEGDPITATGSSSTLPATS